MPASAGAYGTDLGRDASFWVCQQKERGCAEGGSQSLLVSGREMVTCQAVVEEENLFVWQQVEGFGTQVNEGLVCEVVKRV